MPLPSRRCRMLHASRSKGPICRTYPHPLELLLTFLRVPTGFPAPHTNIRIRVAPTIHTDTSPISAVTVSLTTIAYTYLRPRYGIGFGDHHATAIHLQCLGPDTCGQGCIARVGRGARALNLGIGGEFWVGGVRKSGAGTTGRDQRDGCEQPGIKTELHGGANLIIFCREIARKSQTLANHTARHAGSWPEDYLPARLWPTH